MILEQLVEAANAVTDEDISFSDALPFINDCVAKINIECNANFPFYTETDTLTEIPLPEKWQRALFIPFLSARIKQVDSSQFEFQQFFTEFYSNLSDFEMKYNIPEQYQDLESNPDSYPADFSGNWAIGGWRSGGNSNDPLA
jgi:hypothetical protein